MKVRLSLVAVAMLAALIALGVLMSTDSSAETREIPAPTAQAVRDTVAAIQITAPLAVPETTTTAAPVTTTTTAAPPVTAPPVTAPPRPAAPACATWSSQADVDAWMAANAAAHDTSGIDTNGDGKACTLQFAPKPAPAAAAPAPVAESGTGACGGDLPPCYVMMRESGGNIRAKNPSSTASGKWQFLNTTWAGYGGFTRAMDAPESVQDARARQLWAGGSGCSHWSAC